MLPAVTYAIYCLNIEGAAEIAEVIQPGAPRLFIIVGEETSNNSNWMHPRDAVLFVNPGADGSRHSAIRCAMLFAPSYLVAFIDGTSEIDITSEEAVQMVMDANQHGYASIGSHWAISKMHAVEHGFPGYSFIAPVSPESIGVDDGALIELLIDLVPMFEVCLTPAVNTQYKNIRLLLDKHITSYETSFPSAYFVTNPDEVESAREKIKITGKVVCLNGGPDGFEREIQHQNGAVRIYTAAQKR